LPVPPRICAISAFSAFSGSRIAVSAVEVEELAGCLLQNHGLQAREVEETKLQCLRNRRQEGAFRVASPSGPTARRRPRDSRPASYRSC